MKTRSNSWQPFKIDTRHAKWVQNKYRGRFESHNIKDDRFARIAFFHDKEHAGKIKKEGASKKTLNLGQSFVSAKLEENLVSLSVSAFALKVLTSIK
jgi:hypothetical protein